METLIQEEESKGIAKGKAGTDTVETHVFAVPVDRYKGGLDRWKDKSEFSFSHFQKTGHDNCTCFKLHGYPEWWPDKSRIGKGGNSLARQPVNPPADRTKFGVPAAVRANAVGSGSGGVSHPQNGSSVGASLDDLKPEHIQVLLNMVNNKKTGSYDWWVFF